MSESTTYRFQARTRDARLAEASTHYDAMMRANLERLARDMRADQIDEDQVLGTIEFAEQRAIEGKPGYLERFASILDEWVVN